jgi:hypothetical protein
MGPSTPSYSSYGAPGRMGPSTPSYSSYGDPGRVGPSTPSYSGYGDGRGGYSESNGDCDADGLLGGEDTRDTVPRNALAGGAIVARFLRSAVPLDSHDSAELNRILDYYYKGLPSGHGLIAEYLLQLPQLNFIGAAVTLEKAILNRMSVIRGLGVPLTAFTRVGLGVILGNSEAEALMTADMRALFLKVLELRDVVMDCQLPVHAALVDTSSVQYLLTVNMVSPSPSNRFLWSGP